MYTLLVGQPPFETKSLRDTYSKIRKCDYKVPSSIRRPAAEMIVAMLQSNPEKRPNINELLKFEYFANKFIPSSLPISCLTMAPREDQLEECDRMGYNRKPLSELNNIHDDTRIDSTFLKNHLHDAITAAGSISSSLNQIYKGDVENLYKQLTELIKARVFLLNKFYNFVK